MQSTLDGKTIDQLSIDLIDAFVGDKVPYCTMSGGKDSTVEVDLVRRWGKPYELHYHKTGLDAPETIRFIRQYYPECIFDTAPRTFWQGVISNGLPRRLQRWCCGKLKECYGEGRIVLDGVRRGESQGRRARNCFELDKREGSNRLLLHPLFQWSTKDVWQYIDEYHLPHNPLYYTNGERVMKRRIGCLFCPMTGQQEVHRQMTLYPGFVKIYRYYAEQYVQERIKRGTPLTQKTGDEYFDWWIKDH